jgi:hypothetical protein
MRRMPTIHKTAWLIGLLLLPRLCISKSWSARGSVGLLHDTNVFESFDHPVSDGLGRVWFDAAARIHPLGPVLLSVNYSGGLDVYATRSIDDRAVHSFVGCTEIPFWRKASIGFELQAKDKTFLRIQRGYFTGRAVPFLRMNLFDWAVLKASWVASLFDFNPGSAFDYGSRGAELTLESSPLPRVRWSLGYASYELRFKRQAVKFIFPEYRISPWIPLGFNQNDRITSFSASIEAYCWAYWLLRFSNEADRSNGYGYSYRDPEFELVFSKMLPWGLNLKLFWTQRRKMYSDPFTPFLQVRPDAEDETSSRTLLDVSKALDDKVTARLRLARYQNESPFRDLYFRKDIASLGCTYEF